MWDSMRIVIETDIGEEIGRYNIDRNADVKSELIRMLSDNEDLILAIGDTIRITSV